MNSGRPPVWKMIQEAVESGARTNGQIRDWILSKYSGTNPPTISAQINYCTVNSPSRIHGPENKKVKLEPGRLEILYKIRPGMYEPYNVERHGLWQVIKLDNGSFEIHQAAVGEFQEAQIVEQVIRTETPDNHAFAAEAHLRDYLASHLHVIEDGLQPFVDENGNGHVEYRTEVGIIDIIGIDKN